MGTGIELLVGAGFMALAAVAGLVFVQRPLPNRLDTFWMQILPANYTAGWAHELTHFGSLPALIIGMAALLVVGLSRDWVRGDRVRGGAHNGRLDRPGGGEAPH